MYFIMLFVITMKRQLKHMMKHKYVPWTSGKKKFQGKDDKGAVRSFMISNDYDCKLRQFLKIFIQIYQVDFN